MFKSHTIYPVLYDGIPDNGSDIGVDTWYRYVEREKNWINLGDEDVWTIWIDERRRKIGFARGENTGIQNVSVDNERAVYYNLQGELVDNPTNGLYIVKQGSKITKQLLQTSANR